MPDRGTARAIWLTLFATAAVAQQVTPSQPSELVLHGGTREVLLDFVVRDKHQREVKDIRPEEVAVFEDGTRQTVKSFQYRAGKESPRDAVGIIHYSSQALKLDPLREINLVTMVFAGMSPLSRAQAAAMAHDFLRTGPGPNTWIGVFTLNYRLAAIQSYTADLQLLNKAVDRAATGQYQQFAKENLELVQRINSLQPDTKQYLQPYQQSTLGPNQQLPPNNAQFQPLQPGSAEEFVRGSDAGTNAALAAVAKITLRLLFRQEGTRTIDALRSLIRQQAQVPGRKTVLFFSEGLVIPPDQPELLESVISEANRSNLTFYTLDARGLSTVSNSKVSVQTQEAIQTSMPGISDSGPTVMSTDLQANARRLATGTGGFAMDNSNDLRAPLRRVMEDVSSHYEVTYSPDSRNFDGHFRKLAVRISRPGVTIQSRAGYYALPMVAGESLAPFEMAALKALTTQPAQHAFDFHAAALRFGHAPDGYAYRVLVSIPSVVLRFEENPVKHVVAIHVSALTLIKDDRDQVVRKVSKDLSFEAPAGKRAEFQNGETTLILPVDLSAGVYHLETAVIDRIADRASVRRSVFAVPDLRTGGQVSDLVWVRRVQPSSDRDVFDPLETASGTITPSLVPAFPKSDGAHLFFVVYPASGANNKPVADLSVSTDGKSLTTVRLDLPEPNPDGSYPFLETIPTAALAPGQYDVQVKISQQGKTSLLASQFLVQ